MGFPRVAQSPRRPWFPLLSGVVSTLLALVPAVAAEPAGGPAQAKPIPAFAEVQRTVVRYFQAYRDFQPGDLITAADVEPLLAELRQKGLPLGDAEEILADVPGKGEFLVGQFSTPAGRKFMRRIAAYPNVYDRLDRLAHLPNGQQTVRDLIRNPGGEKMVAYMTTTVSGRELGKILTDGPEAKLFTVATGRIYTVAMLLARLQQSHAAATKGAGKRNSR